MNTKGHSLSSLLTMRAKNNNGSSWLLFLSRFSYCLHLGAGQRQQGSRQNLLFHVCVKKSHCSIFHEVTVGKKMQQTDNFPPLLINFLQLAAFRHNATEYEIRKLHGMTAVTYLGILILKILFARKILKFS